MRSPSGLCRRAADVACRPPRCHLRLDGLRAGGRRAQPGHWQVGAASSRRRPSWLANVAPQPRRPAPRPELTWAWNSSGSMRAMTWPFFTTELKSTYSSLTLPDTWEPTQHGDDGVERAGRGDGRDDRPRSPGGPERRFGSPALTVEIAACDEAGGPLPIPMRPEERRHDRGFQAGYRAARPMRRSAVVPPPGQTSAPSAPAPPLLCWRLDGRAVARWRWPIVGERLGLGVD